MAHGFVMDNLPSKNQRTYSTEEQWTGDYWIDGKKIYRKIIIDQSPSKTQHTIPINTTIDTLVDLRGIVHLNSGSTVPIPYNQDANYFTLFLVDGNEGVSVIGTFDPLSIVVFLEYTKTTE